MSLSIHKKIQEGLFPTSTGINPHPLLHEPALENEMEYLIQRNNTPGLFRFIKRNFKRLEGGFLKPIVYFLKEKHYVGATLALKAMVFRTFRKNRDIESKKNAMSFVSYVTDVLLTYEFSKEEDNTNIVSYLRDIIFKLRRHPDILREDVESNIIKLFMNMGRFDIAEVLIETSAFDLVAAKVYFFNKKKNHKAILNLIDLNNLDNLSDEVLYPVFYSLKRYALLTKKDSDFEKATKVFFKLKRQNRFITRSMLHLIYVFKGPEETLSFLNSLENNHKKVVMNSTAVLFSYIDIKKISQIYKQWDEVKSKVNSFFKSDNEILFFYLNYAKVFYQIKRYKQAMEVVNSIPTSVAKRYEKLLQLYKFEILRKMGKHKKVEEGISAFLMQNSFGFGNSYYIRATVTRGFNFLSWYRTTHNKKGLYEAKKIFSSLKETVSKESRMYPRIICGYVFSNAFNKNKKEITDLLKYLDNAENIIRQPLLGKIEIDILHAKKHLERTLDLFNLKQEIKDLQRKKVV